MADESLSPSGEQNKHDNPYDGLTEMPSFKEHMEDIEQESWKETEPEDLRDTKNVIKQLEKMGVKPEILNNPATSELVDEALFLSGDGIRGARDLYGIAGRNKNSYSIDGVGRKEQLNNHQHSSFVSFSSKDGKLTIRSGFLDSNPEAWRGYSPKDFGEDRRIYARPDGLIELTEDVNYARSTEISLGQNGGIYIIEKDSTQTNQQPNYMKSRNNGNLYFNSGVRETQRYFDKEGVEQYRTDVLYEGSVMRNVGTMITPGHVDRSRGIVSPSFNSIDHLFNMLPQRSIATTAYSRIDDRTMDVRDSVLDENRQFDTVHILNCPIHTEHGTDRLIPENFSIANAREIKKEQNNGDDVRL